jgi:hypothetical protein
VKLQVYPAAFPIPGMGRGKRVQRGGQGGIFLCRREAPATKKINSSMTKVNSNWTKINSSRTKVNSYRTKINSSRTKVNSNRTKINSSMTKVNSKMAKVNSCIMLGKTSLTKIFIQMYHELEEIDTTHITDVIQSIVSNLLYIALMLTKFTLCSLLVNGSQPLACSLTI